MTPNRSSSPATDFSVALLHEYVRLGLTDVVLSPGSRSQALALAVAEYERVGLLRLRVRIDERVGGFLALGLAVETARPVLIITTSGTAVANLHPAVLEAHHSGVPLIVASADRPDELRHIGSNQTAEQPGIFGAATTRNWDVAAPIGHSGRPGPVHVNLAFREPLSGPVVLPAGLGVAPAQKVVRDAMGPNDSAPVDDAGPEASTLALPEPALPEPALPEPAVVYLEPAPGTVVVAGAGAGEQAEATARALGVPLLAEITSGAHFGPNLVVTYRELLADENFGAFVRRVIVFGHPTLSREIPALISRADVETTVVRTPGADDYNPGHRVQRFVDQVDIAPASTPSREERAWVGSWVAASRAVLEAQASDNQANSGSAARHGAVDHGAAGHGAESNGAVDHGAAAHRAADISPVDLSNADFARRQLAIVREPVTRQMLVEAVWRSTWPHDRLVFGASRLIRVADQVLTGKRIRAHANRGLAGIDGTVATALGIALASQGMDAAAAGTTRVLIGDLTALHDVGALAFGVGETRPRIQVIVGNDGGGTIFDGLEVAGSGESSALDRVMFTAQTVDFAQLAAAFGWDYLRVNNRGELDEALAASTGPLLIEVPLGR
jgi:2-succinyl-5-enolpyruvyl-6-hydroxy-3-cyclohexene-1-carboxylate synthase